MMEREGAVAEQDEINREHERELSALAVRVRTLESGHIEIKSDLKSLSESVTSLDRNLSTLTHEVARVAKEMHSTKLALLAIAGAVAFHGNVKDAFGAVGHIVKALLG